MLVFIDCGHGARGDHYDPGAMSGGLVEARLVRELAPILAAKVGSLQHSPILVPDGYYSQRHAFVASKAGNEKGVYLQLHCNAGRGRYGLVRPDYRSKGGATLAGLLALELEQLAEVTGHRSDPVYPSGLAAQTAGRDVSNSDLVSWWTRGWGCISGIWPVPGVCGVIVEPGFIDAPEHSGLWTQAGLERIAASLARGIDRYASGA